MWPKLTNIEANIAQKILSYANNTDTSKLNAYIRIFCGAVINEQPGLLLESNTDFKLFKATGDDTFSIYGDLKSSGVLGKDWTGGVVQSSVGRRLRPSPIVKSFSVKEGKDQISRAATLEVTAFSLEQMERLQSYLLEPGYSLFIEWGWNTFDGVRNITKIKNEDNPSKIVNTIADKSLSWEDLSKVRTNSNGEYDCFLGFIVGGSISNEGENFNISINLRGAPSLPTYIQSNQGTTRLDESGSLSESRKVKELFKPPTIEGSDIALRRFAKMFNDLPAFRQTQDIKGLPSEQKIYSYMFINFDEVVKKQINTGLSEYIFSSDDVDIKVNGKTFSIAKEKLFSEQRYIRMDLAVAILNKIGYLDRYEIGGKEITFQIDISNTVIGSFPYQYSTKADKLIIPSEIPDFINYYIQQNTIEQLNGGVLKVDGKDIAPILNSDRLINFRPNKDLNDFGYKEDAGHWGYLKYLFVNFDIFKSKIEQKNKNIREVLLDILNEMSSAVNSYWNFQIVEGEYKKTAEKSIDPKYQTAKEDGDIILTVIDENFIGKNPTDGNGMVFFRHVGNDSVFLDASLDISIPAETTNQIVMQRLDASSQPDEQIVKVGKLFRKDTDLFLSRVTNTGQTEQTDNAAKKEPEKTKVQIIDEEILVLQNQRDAVQAELKKNQGGLINKKRGQLQKQFGELNNQIYRKQNEKKSAAQEEVKSQAEAKVANINAYLDKLNILPNPKIIDTNISKKQLTNIDNLTNQKFIRDRFVAYTFDDTEYLDRLKRESSQKEKTLSHPLPIKYSFKILGNSGIRRGDMFKISGIPGKYAKHGVFQVTEIDHSLEGNSWFTNITGQYRQEN